MNTPGVMRELDDGGPCAKGCGPQGSGQTGFLIQKRGGLALGSVQLFATGLILRRDVSSFACRSFSFAYFLGKKHGAIGNSS